MIMFSVGYHFLSRLTISMQREFRVLNTEHRHQGWRTYTDSCAEQEAAQRIITKTWNKQKNASRSTTKELKRKIKYKKKKKKHDKISFSSYNMQMSFRRSIRKETEKK